MKYRLGVNEDSSFSSCIFALKVFGFLVSRRSRLVRIRYQGFANDP